MKASIIAIATFFFVWISFLNGCRNYSDLPHPPQYKQPVIVTNSFIQEFDTVTSLEFRDWVLKTSNV